MYSCTNMQIIYTFEGIALLQAIHEASLIISSVGLLLGSDKILHEKALCKLMWMKMAFNKGLNE